jgi:LysR family nitrogen assimilation transcriptional regulator
MDIRQLSLFRRVAEEGSFSRAAAVLGITQPALSRRIRALEEELGTTLLYRNGRGVVLTEEGRRFSEAVVPVLEELQRIRADAVASSGALRGRLVVAMPPSVIAGLAPPLMRHVREAMPELDLHLMDGHTGTIHEWLTSGRVDIAVLNPMRQNPAIRSEPLFDAELYLGYAPGDARIAGLLTPAGELPMKALHGLPLMLTGPHHGLRRELEAGFAASEVTPGRIENVDSLHALAHLIAAGMGYTIMAWDALSLELRAGSIAAARIVSPVLKHEFVLATSAERQVSPASRAVIRFLREEVRRLVASGRLKATIP